MSVVSNQFGQPIGLPLPEWSERPLPSEFSVEGRYCRLEPLVMAQHGEALYQAWSNAADGRDWTYMFSGPFTSREQFDAYLSAAELSQDPRHYAVVDRRSGKATGTLALMRQEPKHGVIEVGHVAFSPLMRQTPISTEAHFLLLRYLFETLGYRRCEWKCDSLNAPSRRAAERLGFSYEGLFRQAIVYKGRTRDTAWFSIIDSEWPLISKALSQWLAADNFDDEGRQKTTLEIIRERLQQAD